MGTQRTSSIFFTFINGVTRCGLHPNTPSDATALIGQYGCSV